MPKISWRKLLRVAVKSRRFSPFESFLLYGNALAKKILLCKGLTVNLRQLLGYTALSSQQLKNTSTSGLRQPGERCCSLLMILPVNCVLPQYNMPIIHHSLHPTARRTGEPNCWRIAFNPCPPSRSRNKTERGDPRYQLDKNCTKFKSSQLNICGISWRLVLLNVDQALNLRQLWSQ